MPQQLLAEHPSELIPAALYMERDRDWSIFPLVAARSASHAVVDIAQVYSVQHAMTAGGGRYSVFEFEDLTTRSRAVMLLWVQVQMHRVYEPLPEPRLAALSCQSLVGSTPDQRSGGGGGSPSFQIAQGQREEGSEAPHQFSGSPLPSLQVERGQREGGSESPHQFGSEMAVLSATNELGEVVNSLVDGEDSYVFLPQGSLGEGFGLGSAVSEWNDEERLARIPSGIQAPVEGINLRPTEVGPPCCSVSGLDASLQLLPNEVRWYDTLPGDPEYVDDDPEDLVVSESLLESLDRQRQAKVRVVREQEACFDYELGQGEGHATREWLMKAYVELGELEAQMSRLQFEQLQRQGQAPVSMAPTMARLDPKVATCNPGREMPYVSEAYPFCPSCRGYEGP